MTFDEWKDTEIGRQFSAAFETEIMSYPEIKQDIARAWSKMLYEQGQKYAQPKWTYCKDGLPTEKDGKVIITHETDASFYSHEIKVIRVYVKLETHNPFNETRIDNFCLSTNKFEKYEDLVIAWMPLPEVSNEM